MKLIHYADLARLRLKDFVENPAELWVEETGMHIIVGLGGFERYGESSFGWQQGESYQTAEVTLDLSPTSKLPRESAGQILSRLGLPVDGGMVADELIRVFGQPETDEKHGPRRFLRFICGEEEPYLLGCGVDEKQGLIHLFLARKDYCDQNESL